MALNNRFRVALTNNVNAVVTLTTVIFSMFQQTLTRLNNHTEEKGNVHGMTRGDLGLDLVQNYPPATTDDAAEGKSNTAYITPKRLDEYNKANLYDPLETLFNEAADKV